MDVQSSSGYANVVCNALRIMTNTTTVRIYLKAWGTEGLGVPQSIFEERDLSRGLNTLCLNVTGVTSRAQWTPVFVPTGRGICGRLLETPITPQMQHSESYLLRTLSVKADQDLDDTVDIDTNRVGKSYMLTAPMYLPGGGKLPVGVVQIARHGTTQTGDGPFQQEEEVTLALCRPNDHITLHWLMIGDTG